MAKQKINEKMGLHRAWYEQANTQTLETLPDFIKGLMDNYRHDYGTICHALAAGAVAAASAMDQHPSGGITGFQGGDVAQEFIRNWMSLDGPVEIIQYRDVMYPEHAGKFQGRVISKSTWAWIQWRAQDLLAAHHPTVSEAVCKHWAGIANGVVPFGMVVGDAE